MSKATLTLAALYLAAVGRGLMVSPLAFGTRAIPTDASSELISLLCLLGGPFVGIAALNRLSRNREPSLVGDVLIANSICFGAVA